MSTEHEPDASAPEASVPEASVAATAARPKRTRRTPGSPGSPGSRPQGPRWKPERMIAAAAVKPVLLQEERHRETGAMRHRIANGSAKTQYFVAPLGMHHILGIDVAQYLTFFFMPVDPYLAADRVEALNALLGRLHFYLGSDPRGLPILRCQVLGAEGERQDRIPTLLEADSILEEAHSGIDEVDRLLLAQEQAVVHPGEPGKPKPPGEPPGEPEKSEPAETGPVFGT
jgi:hypothetical protein